MFDVATGMRIPFCYSHIKRPNCKHPKTVTLRVVLVYALLIGIKITVISLAKLRCIYVYRALAMITIN